MWQCWMCLKWQSGPRVKNERGHKKGLSRSCPDCLKTLQSIEAVHKDDKARTTIAIDEGRSQRIERYSAIVAAGGRLFE